MFVHQQPCSFGQRGESCQWQVRRSEPRDLESTSDSASDPGTVPSTSPSLSDLDFLPCVSGAHLRGVFSEIQHGWGPLTLCSNRAYPLALGAPCQS